MWKSLKIDLVTEKDTIFHDLLDECKHLPPGSKLSYNLRARLERHFSFQERSEIVNRVKVGCAPLFIACKRGQNEIVDYLVLTCGANVEQRGLYEVADDRSSHVVTPLWCAAVSGKLSVVESLVKHGADVNAVSDTGSTPVRSACFMTHFNIVRFLVENGADINKANYNGGTCLINSVQSAPLCEFLVRHKADVNAKDIQNKTALHYAIQEHRLETTRLLLKNGANPFSKSRYGDDALQMACLKGESRIFEFLTTTIGYPPKKLANAHELMGCTYLDDYNDMAMAKRYWQEGLRLRQEFGLLPKQPVVEPREGYRFQKEFETFEDLEKICMDYDEIRIQSLIIAERILGPNHKDTIFRLMYRGASYADMMRFQHCIDLWRMALEIRITKDSILYTDTCFTAQALVRLMVDYNEKMKVTDNSCASQRFHDAYCTFLLMTKNILKVRELLTIRPVYKRQADFFDKVLRCITHLIYVLLDTAQSDEEKDKMKQSIVELIKMNPTSVNTEDTLLHFCVSQGNTIRSSYFVDEEVVVIFPNVEVIKFLLDNGAPINARNDTNSTPLHIAAKSPSSTFWAIQLLLSYGAHIDQPNSEGEIPLNYILQLNKTKGTDIPALHYVTLKCLTARVIASHRIKYRDQIPKTLEKFMKLHEIVRA